MQEFAQKPLLPDKGIMGIRFVKTGISGRISGKIPSEIK